MAVRFLCTSLLLRLLCAVLSSTEYAHAQSAITTGDLAALIGEEIPAAPTGYNSLLEVTGAIKSGQEKIIPLNPDVKGVRVQQNLDYANNGTNSVKLDLYQPSKHVTPKGGLIFIHGGGWKHGSKTDYVYYGKTFASKGYVVASIDYRLSGEAPFPAAVEDCKCAVRWMRSHAKDLNIDPDKIIVAGGSAGGHLSLLVAYAPNEKTLEGNGGYQDVSSAVSGVVDIYGPTDLTTDFVIEGAAYPLIQDFLGKSFQSAPELYEHASPIKHLDKTDPLTLILHGTTDDLVPVAQSDALAKRLNELEIPYVYDRLPGWPHAMDLSQRVNDRCVFLMEHFFENVFKRIEHSAR